nr:autotransporter outer membrane beta-barrel domain-containing protein [Campylobacter sp.]
MKIKFSLIAAAVIIAPNLALGDANKSIAETRLDQSQLVNLTQDLLSDRVITTFKRSDDWEIFANGGGSVLKLNSGSHINHKGANANLGLGKSFDDLSFGLAFEYGYSRFDSKVGNTEAKGNSSLMGGAIFAKYISDEKYYTNASFHMGKIKTDHESKTTSEAFDTSSNYYAVDLGGGKIFDFTKTAHFDLYAKYLFSLVDSDETISFNGDAIKFHSLSSHRLKAGFEFNKALRSGFNKDRGLFYAGAAFQYEFANKAQVNIGPNEAPRPHLEGGTVVGDLGWRINLSKSTAFDIGGKAYIGKARGGAANAGLIIKF